MQKKNDLSKIILNKSKFNYILAVDFGNTRDKYSLYDLSEKKYLCEKTYEYTDLKNYNLTNENTLVSLSNVSLRNFEHPFKNILSSKNLREKTNLLSMPIHYTETLGEDRLISAYFLFKNFSEKTCIIDTGTFTTIDFINKEGFLGGFILPGLALLQDSYNKGANLEFLKLKEDSKTLPQSTDNAVAQGAYISFIAPIINILETNSAKKIYLTGEHASLVANHLQNHLNLRDQAIQIAPNLVLKALTYFAEGVLENAHFTRS